ARRHAVVRVNVIDVAAGRVLVDPSVIKYWSVVDTLTIDAHCHHTRIGGCAVYRPWHGYSLSCCGGSSPTAATSAGRQNGVGQTPCVTIQNDVFDGADLFSVRTFDLHADDFARLHIVTGRRS